MNKISWKDSIWFSDVDDTLVDTSSLTEQASEGVKQVLLSHFEEEIAIKIQKNFVEIYDLMLLGLRNKTNEDWQKYPKEKEAFTELWKQVSDCQQEIQKDYGFVKKFSREIFLKLAIEKEGKKLAPEIIYEAVDYYWVLLSQKTNLLPGVEELLQQIKKHKRPLYLVTSSDARLKIKENGQFVYDPQYSENFKRERIQLLREKGIDFNVVSIGDPEDKPHLDFFEKGVKAAEADLGTSIDFSNAIIMGDSFGADLQTPKEKMGFGLAVLFQHDKENTEVVDDHQIITGNLSNITNFLEE